MIDYEEVKRIVAGTKLASVYDYIDEYLKDFNHKAYHEFAPMRDSWEWTIFLTVKERRYRADAEFAGSVFEQDARLVEACELTDKEKLIIVSSLFDALAYAHG